MIRVFEEKDFADARRAHIENGLPENCFPDLSDPLFMVKAVVEENGKAVMASFLRGTSEIYVIVDHSQGTPEQRWVWMQELTEHMKREAYLLGLTEMTAWIPPEIEKSFAKRLLDLGFVRSPWQSYTLTVE